jgi:hypothetical protein
MFAPRVGSPHACGRPPYKKNNSSLAALTRPAGWYLGLIPRRLLRGFLLTDKIVTLCIYLDKLSWQEN